MTTTMTMAMIMTLRNRPNRVRGSMLGLSLLCFLLVSAWQAQEAHAKCPYSSLWMPDSPHKLPDDHPAMKAYMMADAGTHAKRKLQQQEENGGSAGGGADEEKDSISTVFQKGAGTCSYKNPFTQFDTCVQMTGSAWEDTEQAVQYCEGGGIGIPGTVGTFKEGAICDEFQNEQFAGVCVNNDGKEDETTSAFVLVPDNLLASCDLTISGCETFGGGVWYRAGGQCSKDETSEASTSIIDVPAGSNVTLAEGECKLQAGIAGGGHMDREAFWTSACANSNSSYSMPRRWQADTMTITTQKPTRTVGHVWYDVENNRKREDSFLEEGELNIFQRERNNTFLHFGPTFYMIAWKEDGNHSCTIANSPVGILRPNWIIDSEGYEAVSQYLGTEYMMYEGKYRRVKKFRKTEPLEDAYMIQSYDDEAEWDTPEGKKRRPLNRQTPGAPFQGDAVNMYFNHSTEFSDDVFDIYKTLDCVERDFNRSAFQEFAEQENGGNFTGAPGLNFNSSFHVDSSVKQQDCDECDIQYEIRAAEEKGGEGPDTEEESGDGKKEVSEDSEAASVNVEAFSGSEQVNDDVFAQWKYNPSNKSLSLTAELSKDAWFAIAFPEIECLMEPAVTVMALPDGDSVQGNTYEINSHSLSGIQQSNEIEDIPIFSTYKSGDKLVISLEYVGSDFSSPLSVTWAHGFEQKLGYHGGNGRGCFSISPETTG